MKKIAIALLLVAIVLLGATIYSTTNSGKSTGNGAPNFELADLDGNTVKLSDLKGEKIYIYFWASWCPNCVSELGEIDKLSGEDLDFKVLTIVSPNANGEMDAEKFKEWFEEMNTQNMTVLLDTGGKYANAYGVRAYPSSAYIDSKGTVVKFALGMQENSQIKEEFSKIK